MEIKLFLAWYDFWIGFYYDRKNETLYFCPVPTLVIRISFVKYYEIIGAHTHTVIGWCIGRDGLMDARDEEPKATFKRISKRQYDNRE